MRTAFKFGSYGQQSVLPSEQPISGYSVCVPAEPVTTAKYGTVQLPVISGLPANSAVSGFSLTAAATSVMASPVMTETPESVVDKELLPDVAGDEGELLVACSALALKRALVSPAGEQPTKSGAVSLTASHSCLLNCIAADYISLKFLTRTLCHQTYWLVPG